MSTTAKWRRQLARHLVAHAERVLSPIRPTWAGVLESELDHVPEDRSALKWAMGCVWASYRERYLVRSRSLLAAAGIGILLAIISAALAGRIAAIPWPHWYVAFARMHKHLALELWSFAAVSLPIALMAAGGGVLLGAIARKSGSNALPWLTLGVWYLFSLGDAVYSSPAACPCTVRELWVAVAAYPISGMLGVVVPACALVYAFHRRRESLSDGMSHPL